MVPSDSDQVDVLPSDSVQLDVLPSDSVLDDGVRPEAVVEDVMQSELKLSTVEASNEGEQEPACVDDVHKILQAVGHDVRRPSPSDAKKTKSVRVLCGVPAPSSGKKKKRSSARKTKSMSVL
jgi:hypothetical protein